ncbi:hypothetical protein OKW96_07850 [Sphingobacterium sp. KU25419]|nr:hypothetical protein OKW96_07850 [Sphingobacterium sp. KU25419]
MAVSTSETASNLLINSVNDIYNSVVDKPIYEKIGATSNAQKMMSFYSMNAHVSFVVNFIVGRI